MASLTCGWLGDAGDAEGVLGEGIVSGLEKEGGGCQFGYVCTLLPLSLCVSVCLYVSLSVCLSVCLCLCLSVANPGN